MAHLFIIAATVTVTLLVAYLYSVNLSTCVPTL